MKAYKRFRYAVVCFTRTWMFELGLAQVVVGFGLWVAQPFISPGEPPIVIAMSAGALIFSGATTVAVAAQDDATNVDPDEEAGRDAPL